MRKVILFIIGAMLLTSCVGDEISGSATFVPTEDAFLTPTPEEFTPVPEDQQYCAEVDSDNGLNVRVSPTISAPIFRVLMGGEDVVVLSEIENEDRIWAQLQDSGYVAAEFLKKIPC